MDTELTLAPTRRELANRSANGIDVTLTWDSVADSVTIDVFDNGSGEAKTFAVRPDQAMNAFRHPYVYAGLDELHLATRLGAVA
ncbi:MAG: hypothetical protein QOJ31_1480 [Gaiellales bacterium]|jgi:hypothetical protein|nr:hypothetical protein [Gaiellales bacterium]MDX6544241.1 hypothetical protein [Gaiellales bacterium]MDX6550796.1 hypothetical protein [Gaiellales bacterium]